MSLKKYLSDIAAFGAVSETALYTPLATHILGKVLHYQAKNYAINKSGAKGIPDIRIFSGEDGSEWIVCEAKLKDEDIITVCTCIGTNSHNAETSLQYHQA
jgi:hypothetical protein